MEGSEGRRGRGGGGQTTRSSPRVRGGGGVATSAECSRGPADAWVMTLGREAGSGRDSGDSETDGNSRALSRTCRSRGLLAGLDSWPSPPSTSALDRAGLTRQGRHLTAGTVAGSRSHVTPTKAPPRRRCRRSRRQRGRTDGRYIAQSFCTLSAVNL